MEVKTLKTGIHILSTTIKDHIQTIQEAKGLSLLLDQFEKGLTLLDDYDHKRLDQKGKSNQEAIQIAYEEFMDLIHVMTFESESEIALTLFIAASKPDDMKVVINLVISILNRG